MKKTNVKFGGIASIMYFIASLLFLLVFWQTATGREATLFRYAFYILVLITLFSLFTLIYSFVKKVNIEKAYIYLISFFCIPIVFGLMLIIDTVNLHESFEYLFPAIFTLIMGVLFIPKRVKP